MLTREKVRKLHKAIAAAREPGKCRYTKGGQPCCVMGQLAVLEGVSVARLRSWDGVGSKIMGLGELFPEELQAYPAPLLSDVQAAFDLSLNEDAPTLRKRMRNIVARYTEAGAST